MLSVRWFAGVLMSGVLMYGVLMSGAVAASIKHNDLPPRFQWEANFGYCGEVSLITGGLYYGQYVSQFDARALANGRVNQSDEASQLLLGVNASTAAATMHLNIRTWRGAGTRPFLAWVKQQVVEGYPVVIGVYDNHYLLLGDTRTAAGDAAYDHIVPVSTVGSAHSLSDGSYYGDDTLTFSDNGLYGDDTPGGSRYIYTYPFRSFPRTRAQANAKTGPVYSLPKHTADYGIAITGVKDVHGEALPVRVATDVNAESPEIIDGASARPAATPVRLTVTVSGLKPGVNYNLYRYNTMSSVPDGSFNAEASSASERWTIKIQSGTTYVVSERIRSDDTAVYRAVPASAR